jgi:hypothetical protein
MQIGSTCSGTRIVKTKVLAVEGVDDSCFFGALFRHIGLRDCQIIQINGRYPLTDKIEAVAKTSGFPSVSSLGIAIDADKSYSGAFQSVCAALRHSNLPVPTAPLTKANGRPNVTVMIFPKTNTKGTLENLLLDSVQHDPAIPCIDAYFNCLSAAGLSQKHPSKARIHAFLSSREKPDLDCGEAAKANYWAFTNPVFDEVKSFLALL